MIEPKSVSQRMLAQRVGLLKIPFFSGLFGIRFSKLLEGAVEDLKAKGCDRLVIDLRGCLGGSLRLRLWRTRCMLEFLPGVAGSSL